MCSKADLQKKVRGGSGDDFPPIWKYFHPGVKMVNYSHNNTSYMGYFWLSRNKWTPQFPCILSPLFQNQRKKEWAVLDYLHIKFPNSQIPKGFRNGALGKKTFPKVWIFSGTTQNEKKKEHWLVSITVTVFITISKTAFHRSCIIWVSFFRCLQSTKKVNQKYFQVM